MDFCRYCGASIPPRNGEGTCHKCDPNVEAKMAFKPVVHYRPTPEDRIIVGERALVYDVVDHPDFKVSNTPGKMVSTSPVKRIEKLYFETQNTIYARFYS